ncbi:MAG: ribosome-associated translation inhibitor RaiA [candidate division KSB1 bacterium]|nr:ribosome-associated translation inhibitor RaiA [candidate division KSB1 bacterium]
MRTRFTARHYKAPASLKNFAEQEVQRLKKYYDGIIDCEIILDYEKQTQVAEIILSVYGQRLTAIEKSEDIRKSIVLAVDKLERQLKKYKNKWNKKGNHKPAFIETTATETELEEE